MKTTTKTRGKSRARRTPRGLVFALACAALTGVFATLGCSGGGGGGGSAPPAQGNTLQWGNDNWGAANWG